MPFLRLSCLLVMLALLAPARPSHGQGAAAAMPLQLLGVDEYLQRKRAMGVVLLSVNWNHRTNCSGLESARLLGLSFDQVPTARRDEDLGDLVIDDPRPGTTDYAFIAPPGAYALSGFDINVVKSAGDSGGFRALRSRLLKDGFASDGGFDVRAGEIVYIGEFSVECRRQPVPWRSFPEGPAEFQEYLARIKSRFPALDLDKAQFRPMATKQFGAFYAPATVLKDAAARSVAELVQKAKGGDPDSQYWLGMAYDVGNDVPRDLAEALRWYRRAAEAGHPEAQNNVGSALQTEKRFGEAFAWYEKAAAQGNVRGIISLAALYDAGLGVERNRKKASELWSRAADLGWAEAMWSLANQYQAGALGEQDMIAACIWNARARHFAKPFERALIASTDQIASYFAKTLHAGELAACRSRALQWAPKVKRE